MTGRLTTVSARIFAIPLVAALAISSAWGAPWLYQLQNPSPRAIRASGFRAAVVDYSRDGSDAGRLPPGQVKALGRAGIRTLAYLSIGEAENYRFYWRADWVARRNSNAFTAAAPSWLGHTNPDWVGNYKVRYWDPAWRETVLRPYLDRIARQGFTGVYLDIIDAYEYWAASASYGGGGEVWQPGDPRGDRAEAARRMIDLVVWIAEYLRFATGHRMLVFPQNAEDILRYDTGGKYRRAISGIGVEDLFYNETARQPADETRYRLRYLRKLCTTGRKVLCVDYVDTGDREDPANVARIADFVARCRAEGFDFYVARKDRELDRINRVPGVQP